MAGIRVETSESLGTLIIENRSRRNAMNAEMYAAVPGAVADLLADPAIRVIVLRGAGDKAFGAGSDISEFSSQRTGDEAATYDAAEHQAWSALAEIPIPVIAAIHGPCMGGGIAMALHCDIRICADDATFATPPARLGLAYPTTAVKRLIDLVGPAMTKLLLFSARVFEAEEARLIGLVQEVVPKIDLDERVDALAAEIARLAPLTHRATKLSVDSLSDDMLTAAAAAAHLSCYRSADYIEGIHAFMEKRQPIFEGR